MKFHRKVSLISSIVFFLLSSFVFAQNQKIDSLKRVVETGIKDTTMVVTLNSLSIEVLNNEDITNSLVYAQKANELATKLNFKKGKAYAEKNIGLAKYYQGDYMEVLEHWTKSLEIFETIKDTLGIANLTGNLGTIYYTQGSNAKALDYYLQSLNYSEKLKDNLRIATALVNIGGVYGDNPRDYDKALTYYKKIEPYLPKLNNARISIAYLFGIGEIYFKQGNYDEALKYYNQSLDITKDTPELSENYNKLGNVYFQKGNNEKAISYLDLAYQTAKDKQQQLQIVKALISIGNLYIDNDFKKATNAFKEAEVLAKEMETNYELRDIYEGMFKTYAKQGNYSEAFKYQEKFIAQKDSLFNIATDDKIRGLQFSFDLEKKEDQIGLLEKESEIQQLKQKKQQGIIFVSLLVILLIFLLALGLKRRYNFIKETNRIIEIEKNRSENLLHNILPIETAIELKQNGKVEAKKFDSVTVLFTDFKGFTNFAKDLTPEELVSSVDYYFSKFDQIMEKYGMEKIKTIGDAYMCAGGLPFPTTDHPFRMILAAFEIAQFIEETKLNPNDTVSNLDIRIGINTGPIVAGVVGTHKFAYDIWGDTVNVASRMETLSQPGRINISEYTYELVKDVFHCKYRGEIEVKNRGIMKMYFVNGIKDKVFLNHLLAEKKAV